LTGPVLIIVITDIEYRAAKSIIQITESEDSIGLVTLESGHIHGIPIKLGRFPGMGSKTLGSIAAALPQVLDFVKPSCVIEIGICFSLKTELKVGDVCVCSTVSDYEYKKIEDGNSQQRTRSYHSSGSIFSLLSHYALNCKLDFDAYSGVYACGDKLVDDGDFKSQIKNAVPDAMACDMESHSLALICETRKIPWAVVKACSDIGIDKKDTDQQLAAQNSAKFISGFFESNNEAPGLYKIELEINSDKLASRYQSITREITKKENFRIEHIENASNGIYIHYHPDMMGAWLLVYIYKAVSIPDALRTAIKNLENIRLRIDVCIMSRDVVSETRINLYKKLLAEARFSKALIYINTIKGFLFDRIVSEMSSTSSTKLTSDYIDQVIHIRNGEQVKSIKYWQRIANIKLADLNPIKIILGEGGVGKTTLCLGLIKFFQEIKGEHLLLISKSDVLNNYNGRKINTIVDLYREYRREYSESSRLIDDSGFELALSSGSIIVVVDGIDEIESAMGGNFNMDSFIKSINDLNEILGSCKVFLTSRVLGEQRFFGLSNTDIIYLKGFSTADVDDYLDKQSLVVAANVKRIVPKIINSNNFVNPYLLSVATQIFSEGNSIPENNVILKEVKKLDLSIPFEYILARIFEREIEKQSLGISIDDYYDTLEYIIVECKNSISLQDFKDYIGTMLSLGANESLESLSNSYLKCFLFENSDNKIRVSHDPYVTLVRTKSAFKVLTNGEPIRITDYKKFLSILSADPNDILGVREQLISSLWSDNLDSENVNKKIKELLGEFKALIMEQSTPQLMHAIYALHIIAFKFNKSKSPEDSANLLKLLHGGSNITHLYILGDINLIDFSNMTIENSSFINFTKFLLCKFNENTIFRRCKITKSSERYSNNGCKIELFDSDCFLDEEIKLKLSVMEDKEAGRSAIYKSDLKSVLKVFRQGLGFTEKSMNKIKLSSKLSGDVGYEQFVHDLCEKNILKFDSSKLLYSVSEDVHHEALLLCEEGHMRDKLVFRIGAK
jgi:nucleoside phosphorylase